jgi:hypothetical protein
MHGANAYHLEYQRPACRALHSGSVTPAGVQDVLDQACFSVQADRPPQPRRRWVLIAAGLLAGGVLWWFGCS